MLGREIPSSTCSLTDEVWLCGREYRSCFGYDEIMDGVPVVWCFEHSDGKRVGGSYATHQSARQTALDFPEVFRGARIIPCVYQRQRGRFTTLKIEHAFGPGVMSIEPALVATANPQIVPTIKVEIVELSDEQAAELRGPEPN